MTTGQRMSQGQLETKIKEILRAAKHSKRNRVYMKHKGSVIQIGGFDISRSVKRCETGGMFKWVLVAVSGRKAIKYFRDWPGNQPRCLRYLPYGEGEGKPETRFAVLMKGRTGHPDDKHPSYNLKILAEKTMPQKPCRQSSGARMLVGRRFRG